MKRLDLGRPLRMKQMVSLDFNTLQETKAKCIKEQKTLSGVVDNLLKGWLKEGKDERK